MKRSFRALLGFGWVLAAPLHSDVVPSAMFGDHMVLQRGMPVPVWGTAGPGEAVAVRFAGHEAKTTADTAGKWRVELPELEASEEGRTLEIDGGNKLTFEDVLVGEVWVCSGQSNMQYGWGRESQPMFNWGGEAELAALVTEARSKPIRSFTVETDVALEPRENCRGRWSADVSGSAVAFGFSWYLHEALGVPVAVVVTCWGSSSIEGWMPLDMTEQLPHFREIMERFRSSESAQKRVRAAMERGISHGNVFVRKQPNLLYNAMLHPVIPYACRGMVWYQGEANAARPAEYARSLPLWVGRLRSGWGRDDLHVLAVMLPGFGKDDGSPTAKSWARFREAQLKVRELPHTGVVNTIDLGDAANIHPADKAPVCRRLARMAECDVYGLPVEARGPQYESHEVRGGSMLVTFSHAEGLTTVDGEPVREFWLAGEDRRWVRAGARVSGNQVILEADGIAKPAACRYAFCGKPAVNLVNAAGLPAYPFRTDDWEE